MKDVNKRGNHGQVGGWGVDECNYNLLAQLFCKSKTKILKINSTDYF